MSDEDRSDRPKKKQAPNTPLIAIVGPCVSGKSTLANTLKTQGYNARAISQEHSYVKDMWQRFTQPDVLVYLDVTIEAARQRRKISWGAERLDDQAERLIHARTHADYYLLTDGLSAEQVVARVIQFLETYK